MTITQQVDAVVRAQELLEQLRSGNISREMCEAELQRVRVQIRCE